MGEPRSLKPTVLRWLMHTCIVFRRAFISPPMITAEHQLYCLFGWKHKWYALIPYSFIVELGIVSMNAGKMGPITGSDASPWLHSGARWWRPQTGRKRAIKGHLLSFVNSKTEMEKHFWLWLTMAHSGLQIRLVNHTHVLKGFHILLLSELLQCPWLWVRPLSLFLTIHIGQLNTL